MKVVSKTKIRRLGDDLRSKIDSPDVEAIERLEDYRVSYKDTVKKISEVVNKCAYDVQISSVTTYRIKRIESILSKLKRQPKMDLDRMWDIAGCRCVMQGIDQVKSLYKVLDEELDVRKVNDYYEHPADSGYKSLHLYATLKEGDNRPVEIQIRTKDDHNWATLVEIVDVLYDKKIKEGEVDEQFNRFFLIMSKVRKLNDDEKLELIHLIHELNIFKELFSVFVQNYLKVRLKWLNLNKTKRDRYFVIAVGNNKLPDFYAFEKFDAAESEYFRLFKEDNNVNVVLTYLPEINFDNLEIAYSNYTLTTHGFIDDYFKLISEACIIMLRRKEYKRFFEAYRNFIYILHTNLINITEELQAIEGAEVKGKSKVNKWKKDFRKRTQSRFKDARNLVERIDEIKPRRGVYGVYFWWKSRQVRSYSDKLFNEIQR